jgi:dynein heavy chain
VFEVTWPSENRLLPDSAGTLQRLDICFKAEDPSFFADRIYAAYEARMQAESMMRYNLYIDCMPTEDLCQLDSEQVNRIMSSAMSASQLHQNTVDTSQLLNEVNMDYVRTMNSIIFRSCRNDQGMSHVWDSLRLPPKEMQKEAPKFGVVENAEHDFPEQFINFSFQTFLTSIDALSVMLRVREECNRVLSLKLFSTKVTRSLRLEEFQQQQTTHNRSVTRTLKEDWTTKISQSIKGGLQDSGKGWYNLQEHHRDSYEFSKLRKLLRRANFLMQDTLRFLTEDSVREFCAFVKNAVLGMVTVRGTSSDDVEITYPENMGKLKTNPLKRPPPVFVVEIAVTKEKIIINKAKVEASLKAIEDWEANKEDEYQNLLAASDKDSKKAKKKLDEEFALKLCPHEEVLPIEGFIFEYSTEPAQFVEAILSIFERSLASINSIPQVEQMVMDEMFWSNHPVLAYVHKAEGWLVQLRAEMEEKLRASITPVHEFLTQFNKHIEFLNLDSDIYVASFVNEDRQTDLTELKAAITDHQLKKADIQKSISSKSVNLGITAVDTTTIKKLLSEKCDLIVKKLLDQHQTLCTEQAVDICNKYEEVNRRLLQVPADIEQLTDIKEFIQSIPSITEPLQIQVNQMLDFCKVFDFALYHSPPSDFVQKWNVLAWPKKIDDQLYLAGVMMAEKSKLYMDEMVEDQASFGESLKEMQIEVDGFSQYSDLARVDQISMYVKNIQAKIDKAEDGASKFNSREVLFGQDVTNYDHVAQIKKSFEPYAFLWTTAATWQKKEKIWKEGSFLDLEGEKLEKEVDALNLTINKAYKYFERAKIEKCKSIASQIKEQVGDFKPQVPLVIALRNPGMRDRHWEDLSKAIGKPLHPGKSTTLQQIMDMNLDEHVETISKIGEKAGKEHQIESALNNMMEQWLSIDLNILAYRETGTFVLKGVDEIQAILDEHITMTQAMQFSAFKKPFTEKIDDWDKTLSTVAEVLDEWTCVQRSWLYLQPIFESPDINKQLPTEGKRFATVDKNWRQTLGQAKSKPNCIKFCNNEKLRERFLESNKFLDQVQKGLSDYLETKRVRHRNQISFAHNVIITTITNASTTVISSQCCHLKHPLLQ